jgi:cation:H+ antiporter
MEIWLNLGWVLLGLVCLYYGADWLVKGSVAIALAIGIPALIVALTIVAFGTSAPELVVSLNANLDGKGDFALGNVIGSNICNIALVLGIVAILRPIDIHSQLVKRELPFLIVATLAFVFMLIDGQLSRIDGALLTLGVVSYTFFSIYKSRSNPEEAQSDVSDLPSDASEPAKTNNLPKLILVNSCLLLVGFAFLVLGANRLVLGGENLARMFGIPEAIIALTLVAFGTSLPEIATSIVATLKNQGDIVTGNAIGSCIFNLLAVAGITACVSPILSVDINRYDYIVLLVFSGLAYILVRKDFLVSRFDGLVLISGYIVYVVWLTMR